MSRRIESSRTPKPHPIPTSTPTVTPMYRSTRGLYNKDGETNQTPTKNKIPTSASQVVPPGLPSPNLNTKSIRHENDNEADVISISSDEATTSTDRDKQPTPGSSESSRTRRVAGRPPTATRKGPTLKVMKTQTLDKALQTNFLSQTALKKRKMKIRRKVIEALYEKSREATNSLWVVSENLPPPKTYWDEVRDHWEASRPEREREEYEYMMRYAPHIQINGADYDAYQRRIEKTRITRRKAKVDRKVNHQSFVMLGKIAKSIEKSNKLSLKMIKHRVKSDKEIIAALKEIQTHLQRIPKESSEQSVEVLSTPVPQVDRIIAAKRRGQPSRSRSQLLKQLRNSCVTSDSAPSESSEVTPPTPASAPAPSQPEEDTDDDIMVWDSASASAPAPAPSHPEEDTDDDIMVWD